MTPLAITLHASGAETTSGTGSAVDLQSDDVTTRSFLVLSLVVTAITGTLPSLTVTLETSSDETTWTTVESFAAVTAVGVAKKISGDFERYARARWTLSGGGSCTFALAGTARETFCTLEQLGSLGAATPTVSAQTTANRVRHLLAATETAHGYLAKRYAAPILAVGYDVAQAVAQMASLSLLADVVGMNPNMDAAPLVLEQARAKERWFQDISKGLVSANVTDSTADIHEGSGAAAISVSEDTEEEAAEADQSARQWRHFSIL